MTVKMNSSLISFLSDCPTVQARVQVPHSSSPGSGERVEEGVAGGFYGRHYHYHDKDACLELQA